MAFNSPPQRLILPLAPFVAGIIGVLTAVMFALVPTELLESMVVDSGVASVLSAAEPPLGLTARLALIVLCGGGVGMVSWFALFLMFGTRTVVLARAGATANTRGTAPVLRRADSHPDAPPRRPLFATTDLGTPFLDVRAKPRHVDATVIDAEPAIEMRPFAPLAERPLPVDLDTPLAAFDPAAVPEAPLDWFPPPAQLRVTPEPAPALEPVSEPAPLQSIDPSPEPVVTPAPETVAVIEPTPVIKPVREPATPPSSTDAPESVQALLERLERLASRREQTAAAPAVEPPRETIEDTLSNLRRMATHRR